MPTQEIIQFKVEPTWHGHSPTIWQLNETENGAKGYQWECPCGSKGRIGYQSAESEVFKWFRHIFREAGITYPRVGGPAHQWYKEEVGEGVQA